MSAFTLQAVHGEEAQKKVKEQKWSFETPVMEWDVLYKFRDHNYRKGPADD